MIKLNEKSKSVFLYSKDGSKNDAPVKAFEALKAALGDTTLTAENFKQFAAGFQEFINASSVQAAPAADDADPNADNVENTENSGADTNSTDTINTKGSVTPQPESIQRLKPSSLLSMKN